MLYKKYNVGRVKAALWKNEDGSHSVTCQTSYNKDDVWYNKPRCKKCGEDVDFSLFPQQVLDYIALFSKMVEDEPGVYERSQRKVVMEEVEQK